MFTGIITALGHVRSISPIRSSSFSRAASMRSDRPSMRVTISVNRLAPRARARRMPLFQRRPSSSTMAAATTPAARSAATS